jgi:hypothetical protein
MIVIGVIIICVIIQILTFDFIRDNYEMGINDEYDCWCWFSITIHKNITWEIIQDNLEYPWDFDNIIQNPNITLDIIINNHKKYKWDVAKNLNITWQFLQDNQNIIYDMSSLSMQNIPWEIIINNLNVPWNFGYIMRYNQYITYEIVQNHPNFKWDKYKIQSNSMIIGKHKYIKDNIIHDATQILKKIFTDSDIIELICNFI